MEGSEDLKEASPHAKPVDPRKYSYANFLGGVLSFRAADFRSVNGYPNSYWGWGLEDDQLGLRMRRAQIRVLRVRQGHFEDLDPLNMKEILEGAQGAEKLKEQLKWYNVEMFRKGELLLDADWRSNGLQDLEFRMLRERREGILRHVVVELT